MTYKNRLPLLTEKLRTQIKDKNAMHTMVILNPDDQQLRVKYKKQRNELTSLLRNSEINHYSDDLELHKSDLHKTWGILKTTSSSSVDGLYWNYVNYLIKTGFHYKFKSKPSIV